jgi:hypothetical protein
MPLAHHVCKVTQVHLHCRVTSIVFSGQRTLLTIPTAIRLSSACKLAYAEGGVADAAPVQEQAGCWDVTLMYA